MPDSETPSVIPDGIMAQILLKQGEMGTQLAVIGTKLDAIPFADHESRIRSLERFRYTLAGGSFLGGVLAGFIGYFVGHLVK
jgi:hypothetical protein